MKRGFCWCWMTFSLIVVGVWKTRRCCSRRDRSALDQQPNGFTNPSQAKAFIKGCSQYAGGFMKHLILLASFLKQTKRLIVQVDRKSLIICNPSCHFCSTQAVSSSSAKHQRLLLPFHWILPSARIVECNSSLLRSSVRSVAAARSLQLFLSYHVFLDSSHKVVFGFLAFCIKYARLEHIK